MLAATNLSKSFHGNPVLKAVGFDVRAARSTR